MKYGYARISTTDQNLNLQIDALTLAGCDRIFQDVISGRRPRRPGFDEMMGTVLPGDSVVVWRVDRLGRSFYHLVTVAEELRLRGVNFISLTEGIDCTTATGQALFRLICIVAEIELENLVMRTKAGLSAAKTRGQTLGRPRKLSTAQIVEAERLLRSGESPEDVAHRFGVGRTTLFRARALERSAAQPTCATQAAFHSNLAED